MTVDQNEEALGMSNKAFRAIADALREQGAHFPRVGARLILDALKAAGIELVELPEPTGRWAEGPEWRPFPQQHIVVWTGKPGSTVMIQNVEPGDLTPDEARGLAAALLAAANAAEEHTPQEYRSGT